MPQIFVDADACSVKQEVLKVAKRLHMEVTFVANSWMRIADQGDAKLVVVEGRDINAADDWIAEHASQNDIVITADIPLADRCLKVGAKVIDQKGRPFTEANIGQMLGMRELMSQLRDSGAVTGGPPPFRKEDRSRFLHALDQLIQSIQRLS